jgi:hypothetical protein
VPSELELRYTLYSVAPETAFQLMVMLLDEFAVAVTPVGVAGADPPPPPDVVAEVYAD